jgi:hypothetical protein
LKILRGYEHRKTYTFEELKIEQITVFGNFQGTTKKGIGLNKSISKQVLQKYGRNKYKILFVGRYMHYPYKNIGFKFDDFQGYKDVQWLYFRWDKGRVAIEITITNYEKCPAK